VPPVLGEPDDACCITVSTPDENTGELVVTAIRHPVGRVRVVDIPSKFCLTAVVLGIEICACKEPKLHTKMHKSACKCLRIFNVFDKEKNGSFYLN
jgi:hypothetical protein